MGQERLSMGFRRPRRCPGLSPQLLEKWILSEKEWEREKAMNLHLRLMQIYVQSVGVCVSAGSPGRRTVVTWGWGVGTSLRSQAGETLAGVTGPTKRVWG